MSSWLDMGWAPVHVSFGAEPHWADLASALLLFIVVAGLALVVTSRRQRRRNAATAPSRLAEEVA